MEHEVRPKSQQWFDMRHKMVVTASRFADAIGVGKGKPYDFLESLIASKDECDIDCSHTRHGDLMEPIIHEAYGLLTRNKTRNSGFWTIIDDRNPLKGKIGATPDAVVIVSNADIGLCEFKAPVYSMYPQIPSCYMVQMQGQMAVTGFPWCDFLAICQSSREIMMKRVYFNTQLWNLIAERLLVFCNAFQDFKEGYNVANSKHIQAIKLWKFPENFMKFESKVKVTNLLSPCMQKSDCFCGPSGFTLPFDLLLGSFQQCDISSNVIDNKEETLQFDETDDDIEREMIGGATTMTVNCDVSNQIEPFMTTYVV